MGLDHGAIYEHEYQEEGDTFWILCLDEPQRSGPNKPIPNGLVAGRVPGLVLDGWVADSPCHWCGCRLGDEHHAVVALEPGHHLAHEWALAFDGGATPAGA
jgi:hypothetical protein